VGRNPIKWVIVAAYAAGTAAALAASMVLTIDQVIVHIIDGRGLGPTAGSVMFFIFAFVVGGAFDALRRYDREASYSLIPVARARSLG
jgi:hypothetical protein